MENGEKDNLSKPLLINDNRTSSENDTNFQKPSLKNDSTNIILEPLELNSNDKISTKKIITSLLFGQLLSLLCVGSGYFTQYIENQKKLSIPLLLNATYYFFVFILYGCIILKLKIKKPKWIFIILSILDSQANYINMYVFSFINFNYPYIINVLSNMWSVIFTAILIKKYKYLKNHMIGIAICIIGILLSFIGTFESFNKFLEMFIKFNDQILGLILCIITSVLYGLNAVLQEKFLLNDNDVINYCSWLSIIGFFVSIFEALLFNNEFSKLIDDKSNLDFLCFLFWILASLLLAAMTSYSPYYIQKFSANIFNISLLFTIFWSFIFNLFFIEEEIGFSALYILFFLGFILVIIGMVIFSSKERKVVE